MNQLQLFNKDKITNIIKENNGKLTIKELLNIIGYDINKLNFDKLYNNIENDKWLYIDNDMLIWIGYDANELKKNKQSYSNLLKENFEENIDYKLINNKEFQESSKCTLEVLRNKEVNTHNKTKHLIVSPDCFKLSLMLLRTKKAKKIREYYIELEKIFKFYVEYQNQYQLNESNKLLEEKDKIIQTHLHKNKVLKENIIYKTPLTVNGFIYVVTNKRKAKLNEFKLGCTISDPKSRISSFNVTSTTKDDTYYLCYYLPVQNSKHMESLIFSYLKQFNIGKENYRINYELLIKLLDHYCNNDNNNMYVTNKFIRFYQDIYFNKEPIIPKLITYEEEKYNDTYIYQDENIFEEEYGNLKKERTNNYNIDETSIINKIEEKISKTIESKIINTINKNLEENELKSKIIDNIEYNIVKENVKNDLVNEIKNSKQINCVMKSKVTNLIENNNTNINGEFKLIMNESDINLDLQYNIKEEIIIPIIEKKQSPHLFIDHLRDQLTKEPKDRELTLTTNKFAATIFKKMYKDYCKKNNLISLNNQQFKNIILSYCVEYLPSKNITYYIVSGFKYPENHCINFLDYIKRKINNNEYTGNVKVLGNVFYTIYNDWCVTNKIKNILSQPIFLTNITNNISKSLSRKVNGRKTTYNLNMINIY